MHHFEYDNIQNVNKDVQLKYSKTIYDVRMYYINKQSITLDTPYMHILTH